MEPVVLDTVVAGATDAAAVKLVLIRADGTAVGELALAKADLRKTAPAPRWPAEKPWQWYSRQPWLVGCNFLPSTAVNDVEMWQKESFDPKTIDRELGWAAALGFNSCRVFVQYLVWQNDPAGLKQRLDRFLSQAAKHRLTTTQAPV